MSPQTAALATSAGMDAAHGADAAAFVRDVPPLPEIVAELLALVQREDVSLPELTARLSRDPALAARTLRLANSSFYGLRGRVANVRDALVVLGMRQVRSMVTAAALASQLPAQPGRAGDPTRIAWRHALATAVVSRRLAEGRAIEPDTAFTAGLVHDLGRLVLIVHHRAAYDRLEQAAAASGEPRVAAERTLLELDHAEIGHALCRKWHFADAIARAVRSHHEPGMAAGDGLSRVVHVADAIVHAADLEARPEESVPPIEEAAWSHFGLADDDLVRLMQLAERAYADAGLLGDG